MKMKSTKKKFEDSLEHFLERIEELTTKTKEISDNITVLTELQSKILIEPSQTERTKLTEKHYKIVHSNKILGKDIFKQIKAEQDKNEKLERNEEKSSELRVRKSQLKSVTENYKTVWESYNNNQVEFREKNKKALVRNIRITDPNSNVSNEEVERRLDEGDITILSSIIKETQQAKVDLEQIESRHKEFLKLEKGVTEVHELFMDLSRLVELQGESVERIEDSVNRAQLDMEKATKELDQAKRKKKAARKKKFILAGILAGVSLILLLVLLITFL